MSKVRYVWRTRVLSVEEKFETAGVRATGQTDFGGKPIYETVPGRSMGWFVRISDSSAICVGDARPDLKPGDLLRMTMEREE